MQITRDLTHKCPLWSPEQMSSSFNYKLYKPALLVGLYKKQVGGKLFATENGFESVRLTLNWCHLLPRGKI